MDPNAIHRAFGLDGGYEDTPASGNDKGKDEATGTEGVVEVIGTVEEALPELGLDERGGEDPCDGKGEVLLNHGVVDLPFDIADMSKTYGPSQRGAIAPKEYAAGTLIFHEIAAIWVAIPAPVMDESDPEWEHEAAKVSSSALHCHPY